MSWRCWFGWHTDAFEIGPHGLRLACCDCGRESPGITWIQAPPPPKTARVLRFTKRLAED
jgi:hypothetical protein